MRSPPPLLTLFALTSVLAGYFSCEHLHELRDFAYRAQRCWSDLPIIPSEYPEVAIYIYVSSVKRFTVQLGNATNDHLRIYINVSQSSNLEFTRFNHHFWKSETPLEFRPCKRRWLKLRLDESSIIESNSSSPSSYFEVRSTRTESWTVQRLVEASLHCFSFDYLNTEIQSEQAKFRNESWIDGARAEQFLTTVSWAIHEARKPINTLALWMKYIGIDEDGGNSTITHRAFINYIESSRSKAFVLNQGFAPLNITRRFFHSPRVRAMNHVVIEKFGSSQSLAVLGFTDDHLNEWNATLLRFRGMKTEISTNGIRSWMTRLFDRAFPSCCSFLPKLTITVNDSTFQGLTDGFNVCQKGVVLPDGVTRYNITSKFSNLEIELEKRPLDNELVTYTIRENMWDGVRCAS